MPCTLLVAWDERLAAYDFGPGHPLAPVRVELTMELARAFGLFDQAGVTIERPALACDAELELVHDPRYIAAVRRAGCIMRCAGTRAVSACTTTRRSRSPGCSRPARSGSPMSISTSTTGMACKLPSTTIP